MKKKSLIDTMQNDFKSIIKDICKVDAANAQSFVEDDRIRIKEAIEKSVGMERLNEVVMDPIRNWLLKTALDELESVRLNEPESKSKQAELLRGLGLMNYDLGHLLPALQAFEEGYSIRTDKIGQAGDLTNIATIQFELGNLETSLNTFQKSLDLYQSISTTTKSNLSSIRNNIGLVLRSLHRYDEAENSFKEAIELGGGIDVSINLSEVYRELGNPTEAKKILEIALVEKESILGTEHPEVAQICNLLGQSIRDLGDFDNAKIFFERSLRIRKKVFGENNHRVALVLLNLAELEYKKNTLPFDEIISLFEKVKQVQVASFGKDHDFVQATQNRIDELMNKNVLNRNEGNNVIASQVNNVIASQVNNVIASQAAFITALPNQNLLSNVYFVTALPTKNDKQLQREYSVDRPVYDFDLENEITIPTSIDKTSELVENSVIKMPENILNVDNTLNDSNIEKNKVVEIDAENKKRIQREYSIQRPVYIEENKIVEPKTSESCQIEYKLVEVKEDKLVEKKEDKLGEKKKENIIKEMKNNKNKCSLQ